MFRSPQCRWTTALIVSARPRTYLLWSMIRLLSLMVAAMALFFSPLAMMSGSGMAMSHAPVASTSSVDGHCDGSGQDDQGSGMEAGCAAGCAAVAPSDRPTASQSVTSVKVSASPHQLVVGIFPEGETPPPRNTPEI